MKKTLLLIFLMVGTFAMAQEGNASQELGKTTVVTQNPGLLTLANDVIAKETAYQNSLTGSRTTATEASQAYTAAIDAYILGLENALVTATEAEKIALNEELQKAKALKPQTTTQRK